MYISFGLIVFLLVCWICWKLFWFTADVGANVYIEAVANAAERKSADAQAMAGEWWHIKEVNGQLMQNVNYYNNDEFRWVPYNKEGADLAERFKKNGCKDHHAVQMAMFDLGWFWNDYIHQWYKIENPIKKEALSIELSGTPQWQMPLPETKEIILEKMEGKRPWNDYSNKPLK